MILMKDIAALCGVSLSTVSKALHDHTDVSDTTKEKICETAQMLGYRSNLSSQDKKASQSHCLGLILPDDPNEKCDVPRTASCSAWYIAQYQSFVMQSFINTVKTLGYDLLILSYRDGFSSFPSSICSHLLDGICAAWPNVSPRNKEILSSCRIPLVAIDSPIGSAVSICHDIASDFSTLLSYVNHMGQRRIAFIYDINSSWSKKTLFIFHRISAQFHWPISEEYIQQVDSAKPDSFALATASLLALPVPPTCILYPNDIAAAEGFCVANYLKIRIPEDLGIVSCCHLNTPFGSDSLQDQSGLHSCFPSFTSMMPDTDLIGSTAAKALISLSRNKEFSSPKLIAIPGTLKMGNTLQQDKG